MPRVHRGAEFYAGGGEQADRDLEELTKAELVDLADAQGVDSTGTKAEIIAALRGD